MDYREIEPYKDKNNSPIQEEDFSFSEKMKWAEELKKEYSKIAKENMSEGGKGSSTLTSLDKIDTREQVAKDLDIGSGETYRKAEFIHKNGDEELNNCFHMY